MPQRLEFLPTQFRATDAGTNDDGIAGPSHLSLVSAEGVLLAVHVLDQSIVRVRVVPETRHHRLQLATHAVAPVDPLDHHASAGRVVSARATPITPVAGTPRRNVCARFPCPPPDITRLSDTSSRIDTDAIALTVNVDKDHGGVTLSWASRAVPDSPFLEDLPHRAYAIYEDGLGGARHFVKYRPQRDLHYGLAERSAPTILLNGRRFRLETMDALGYDAASTDPLYKLIPFSITLDKETRQAYGVFYDSLSSGVADFGHEIDAFWGSYRHHSIDAGCGLDMYVIFGPSIEAVVEGHARVVGLPVLPPRYSLGYLASAMGYAEAENAQEMIARLPEDCKKYGIPCDMLHLSSGYTVDPNTGVRNVFTWNKKRFPDPLKLVKDLRDSGIRIAANIKPWLLKQHPDYSNVLQNRGFVWDPKRDDASLVRLWSAGGGDSAEGSYIDMSSPGGREYWKNGVKALLSVGIEGIWNDNNEYALINDGHTYAASNLDGTPSTVGAAGRALQTFLMATASYEAMIEAQPKRRPFLITRAASTGTMRYASQSWSGDNLTSWETLKHNIPMGLNAGLCGVVGYGHDVGGFVGPRPEPELFLRWVQSGVLHPRFCIHSWKYEGVTEPWMYPSILPHIREAILLRYKLLPYLYTLTHEASRTGHPVIRPLVYHYQLDPAVETSSFEYLLGKHLLVASVFERGATERRLRTPNSGDLHPWCDVHTGQWYPANADVVVPAPLERCGVILALAGALIPTAGYSSPDVKVDSNLGDERIVWCFPGPGAASASSKVAAGRRRSETVFIEDDGESLEGPVTEIKVWMETSPTAVDEVCVGVTVVRGDFKDLKFDGVWFVLPIGDARTLKVVGGAAGIDRIAADGRTMIGVSFKL